MISEQSFVEAAKKLQCEVRAIKAVAEVESRGDGFLPSGEVKILFEPHIFWQQLRLAGKDPQSILSARPDLEKVLYRKWRTFPYGKNSTQWGRLFDAATVHMIAAHKSASYGRFQIMGFNHQACGFSTVLEFVEFHEKSEDNHLQAFVNLVQSWGLQDALQKRDWTAFAKRYNGPGYDQGTPQKTDDYDYKMAEAYKAIK